MEMGHYRNVIDVIVKNDLCSGCGVCAGICPTSALTMEWNAYGELVPLEKPDKCFECGLCLKSCPFWNQDENETSLGTREYRTRKDVKYNSITGFYTGLFSGYSMVGNHRNSGASGGMATWLLEKMISLKMADYACCVTHTKNPDKLFKYSVLNSAEDIRAASRSVYYPVELSDVISSILKRDARHVVIGLPCMLKALRLAMLNNGILKKRIVFLAGLVCGQQKSRFFCEYLCTKAGGDASKLIDAAFRIKDINRHHLDHRFEFSYISGNIQKEGHIYQSDGMGKIWGQDYFKLNACNLCDDITSETADVTFGDAISEPYCYGNRGANFIIARSKIAFDILKKGALEGEIVLNKAPLRAVIKRQKGTVLLKRSDLRHRLYLARRKKNMPYVPIKRFLQKRRLNPFHNFDMEMRDKIRLSSRDIYARLGHQKDIVCKLENIAASIKGNKN